MQEPYGKAVATRTGPEPWRCGGNAVAQASAGVRAGWVLSREIFRIRGVEAIPPAEDPAGGVASARHARAPRGRRPHART